MRNQVTALAFNPSDQKFLAVGESTGKVLLFDVEKRELILSRWVYQSGRISSLSWKEDGKFIASASLDQSIFVYSVDKPSEVVSAKVSLVILGVLSFATIYSLPYKFLLFFL